MTSIQSLPASAEVVIEDGAVSNLQSYVTPTKVAVAPIVRDTFGITVFSVVQWPVPSSTTISSGFGIRHCRGCSVDHKGIDLVPGNGYPIQAVADGVVTEVASSDSGLGVHVIIQHLVDGQVVSSLYGHMQFGSMGLHVGDTVKRGQQLGLVGDTGHSTGPHLHFGILVDGVEIDPYPWLLAHANV
jgi:murein DD-endopeptidase MepM/ murein hydrolase activator NlpD